MTDVALAERPRSARPIDTPLVFVAHTTKYCQECDRPIETGNGFPYQEQSQRALEHFFDTGHTVDSKDSSPRLPRRPVFGRPEVRPSVLSEETVSTSSD